MCLHLPMHSRNISKWWHCLVCCRFANLIHVVVFRLEFWSKTLQSRPNLSSSCPARCHLSNSDQSCLGEATAKGLTRAAHTCTQLILRIPLVNARFGLEQWILNPHPKFKISASEKEGMNWFDWAFVVHNIGWGCSRDADCGQARYAK